MLTATDSSFKPEVFLPKMLGLLSKIHLSDKKSQTTGGFSVLIILKEMMFASYDQIV